MISRAVDRWKKFFFDFRVQIHVPRIVSDLQKFPLKIIAKMLTFR